MATVQITVKGGVIACMPNRLPVTAKREPSVEWTCKDSFEVRFKKGKTPFKDGKHVFKKGDKKKIRKNAGPPAGATKPKEYKYTVTVGTNKPLDPFIDVS